MENARLPQIKSIDWLNEGPLAPHVVAFKQYLTERGYARNSFVNCIGGVTHFAQWIHRRCVDVQRIDESILIEFLDGHLPSCRCIGSVQCHRASLSAALGHLLVVLRARGVIAPPVVSKTPVDDELGRYGEYMLRVRGLARTTQAMALGIVRRFLTSRFGDYAMDIAAIRSEHVRHFFAQEAKRYSKPATTGAAIAAYLKDGRPKTSNRAVFVRHLAPRDQPVGPDLVRKTIRQAYARAGLPYTRSHLLRHTMANRLLAGGSSLKEVADVLRHRSLNSTLIYAKLDSRKLVEVALPWPGSAS